MGSGRDLRRQVDVLAKQLLYICQDGHRDAGDVGQPEQGRRAAAAGMVLNEQYDAVAMDARRSR